MKLSPFALCAGVLLSGFASQAMAQEAVATPVGVPAATIPKLGPITVTVDLINGQSLNGTLTDATMLPIKTSYGDAEIPYMQIAGVRLASSDDSSTTIVFKNGDSITGATDLKILAVDTEWGSAKINGSSVKSILLLPDLKWNATIGLNGKRWSLVDAKAAPGPTNPVLPGSPNTRPGNPSIPSGTLPSGARIITGN